MSRLHFSGTKLNVFCKKPMFVISLLTFNFSLFGQNGMFYAKKVTAKTNTAFSFTD